VEMSANGTRVIFDAGTGLRGLGRELAAEGSHSIHICLTHLHLDHIEGLGFFGPLFDPECVIRVWGPRPIGGSLRELLAMYLSPPFFPVGFERIPAQLSFTEVGEESWEVGGLRISSVPVRHPGSTVGYRLSENGFSLAYIPDNEPALDRKSGLSIAGGADVLLHDAQFTDAEYPSRVGWGHSAVSDFVTYLAEAAPQRALMFHHDPSHADAQLEEMLSEVRARSGRDDVELAFDGLDLDLAADHPVV